MPPPNADFSFRIAFKKRQGNPRRIFDAAGELIDGFRQLDEAVAGSVDVKLQPSMVLEDIKAGSIRVFLSSLLKKIDDEGLRQGEIKKAIGPALVDAKYAAIGWLDKDQQSATAGAIELRETLRKLAATSDLSQLGDYAPIHEAKLIAALDSIQNAKRLLGPKDKLLLEAPGHQPYKVDLTQTWDPSDAIPLPSTTTEKHSEGEIILTIRKPDMTGHSKWQFTQGKFPVFAKIVDEDWLDRFHSRKVKGFHSGDAMRCKVKFTYIFDDKGTMIDEHIEVTHVIEIIAGSGGEQLSIL
ncbi:hypothetical protein AB7M49_008471 [Bradyrhizobium elkanii]